MDLGDVPSIAASGMRAQGDRLRVISENMANANSTATAPGVDPYRRKMVFFQSVLDRELGVKQVKVAKRSMDPSPFNKRYDPSHPAADGEGYVLYPNVNTIVEMMDMREARRGYEANLNMVEVAKSMLSQTVALLK